MDWLIDLDLTLFTTVNSLAGYDPQLDSVVKEIATNDLFKGVVIGVMFWWLWFRPSADDESRPRLVSVLIVSVGAILVGRFLAWTLPFRDRPIHVVDLEVRGPYGAEFLRAASSFPSDHAVLYFSLAIGFMFVSQTAGTIALLHAALVISLPRVFLGLHYPSDVLVGALLGASISALLVPFLSQLSTTRDMTKLIFQRYSYIGYPVMFFITFEFSSMFTSLRGAAKTLYVLTIS